MIECSRSVVNKIKPLYLLLIVLFLLTGCEYAYKPTSPDQTSIKISLVGNKQQDLLDLNFEKLNFQPFENGSLVDFKNNHMVFKIATKISDLEPQSLMILPHYLDDVHYLNSQLELVDSITKNTPKENRSYSTNILAFNLNSSEEYIYIAIVNAFNRKVLFSVENSLKVRSYDQKLSYTFVSVYTAILTLFFINLIFFYFVRKINYLYYALYLFFSLFALLFQEGFIAYFPTLSQSFLGVFTQAFWLKLPTIFFLLFVFNFLDMKKRSKFDTRLLKAIFIMDIFVLLAMVFLYSAGMSSLYSQFSFVLNIYSLIGIVVLLYIAIKYTSLKVPMAKYLLFGWIAYYGAIVIRIFYSFDVEPLAFWLPRAFEFGLLINAFALSFGLADKTLSLIIEKENAHQKIASKDRTIFCNELVKTFQVRANKTIEKYYGDQQALEQILNGSFVSSIKQLIDVIDVFYVHEFKTKLGFQKISNHKIEFNVAHYIEDNRNLLNTVCEENKAVLNLTNLRDLGELPFIIIPIHNHKYDNLCLFLTIPSYEVVTPEVVNDLNQYANDMTVALIEARKFKKTTDAARFDGLTRVLNRKSIMEKLTEILTVAELNNNTITYAFLDVDNFKQINDRYGHDVGDDCLIFLSNQLRKEFNENCYIGRFGGDEFIVLFNNLPQSEVEHKLNNLFSYFAANIIKNIEIQISVGIAIATPENDLFNVKKLMKAADISLYESKHKGKNQFTFSKWSDQAQVL